MSRADSKKMPALVRSGHLCLNSAAVQMSFYETQNEILCKLNLHPMIHLLLCGPD